MSFLDEPERAPVVLDRPLTVGRDAASDVRIDDESVSRLHVRLEPGNPPVAVDCESRNGTFLGSDRLVPKERSLVPPGSVVRVGGALLLVDWEAPASLRDAAPASVGDPFFYAKEGPMAAVLEMADRLAADDISVLLTGETGVGKEVLARYLHRRSPRKKGPFVPVHAAALSPSLFESELFGHERGSFTGADRIHRGHFERADGGTLFLDEICEMPKEAQVKLLRVLESGTFTRVGGDRAIQVNVRIIAAAKADLERAAAEGRFRSDLLYRLKVIPIVLPPLRERQGDLTLLANHFVAALNLEGKTAKRLTSAALEELHAHAWPGNVRELKHALERAYILSEEAIGREFLSSLDWKRSEPEPLASPAVQSFAIDLGMPLADAERQFILATLELVAGSKTKAAELLQISTKTLYSRLREYRASGHWLRVLEDAEPASA